MTLPHGPDRREPGKNRDPARNGRAVRRSAALQTAPATDPPPEKDRDWTRNPLTLSSVVLLHLGDEQGARAVNAALERKLAALPEGLRRTLTWDQGAEMAGHRQVTAGTGAGVFVCNAHAVGARDPTRT